MLTGLIWLVPAERVPEGAWLLGVAAILLGVDQGRADRARKCGVGGWRAALDGSDVDRGPRTQARDAAAH